MYHDAEESGTKSTFKLWKRPNKRCTVAQKKALVDYMSTHIRLARYECDPETADIEWQHLADTLNRSGTVKTVEAWKVTWRDLRRKAGRDQAEARATNCSINEISQKIREIMADSDEDVIGSNICLSPTQSVSIHSPVEESDPDNDFETDMTLAQESLVQTMEVPAEYMAQTRASPANEFRSFKDDPESSSDSSPSNSPTPMNKTRCTQDQMNALVDCMAINTSMAFGRQNTAKKAGDWKRLRHFLNRMGPAKRTVAWQKTWRDLKRSAVNSVKTNSAYTKPTTKKIMDIIDTYAARLKDDPNEFSADDTDLFLPPDGTFHRAPSPLSEYVTLPNEDNAMIHETRNHNVSVSPARQSCRKISPVHESVHETGSVSFMQYENEDDSDADSEQFKLGKKKKMRCTNAQKIAIVDFMAQHPALATARSQTDGDTWRAEWRQLSKHLNKIGTAKTTASWKRTWRELKKNARCNRASNHKWAEINQKILSLIENTSTEEPTDKHAFETIEEHEPCPTDDMPLISLRKQSHTDPHTPEVILYEENQSNDITEADQGRKSQSLRSGEVSPERRNSMSPQQDSDEDYSPVQDKKEQSLESKSQKAKNARCTPSQINALMNYMAKHPSLAKAKCLYMPKGRDPWYSEWRRLTLYLNSLNKMGPAKSTTGWKVTWRSLCLNARRKKSKQCPSYERVYKKVLEILHEDPPDENGPAVTKLEPAQDCDMQSPDHRIIPPDPVKCEQAPSYTSSVKMSPKQHSSDSHIQRGSRMSPVRISDQVSPAQRNSDGMSPGLPKNEVHHANLVKLGNQPKPSRERWGMKPRKVRCSNAQLRALADYMIAHPGLATDKYIDHREPAWLRLTKYLNDLGPARKRTEAWKRTWRDIKNGVRARGRNNKSSGALKRFRELKVLKLIGMASPDRKNIQCENNMDPDNFTEEYVLPEPEVILTPHAPTSHPTQYSFAENPARNSPRNERLAGNEKVDIDQRDRTTEETSVPTNNLIQEMFVSLSRSNIVSPQTQYNLSEVLRVNDKVCSMEETVPIETTSLLQMLILEVRRSNELNAQQNSYLREILKQLRTQNSMHATRHANGNSRTNHGINAHELKKEVSENTLEIHIQAKDNSQCNESNDSNQIPFQSSPAIRPISLSALTSPPKQHYEGMNVQSILQGNVKPTTPKGDLVRLKDGTMVLVPENLKMEAADHDGDSQYVVQNVPQIDEKFEAKEDPWHLKTKEINEC